MTNTVNLFPFIEPINEKDTVLSAFGLATPFGRSVAYTALHTGANFATLPSTNTLREDGALAAVGSLTQCSFAHVELTGSAKDQADVISALSIPGQPAPTVLFLSVLHLLSSVAPNINDQVEFALGVVDDKHSQSCAQELAVPAGMET